MIYIIAFLVSLVLLIIVSYFIHYIKNRVFYKLVALLPGPRPIPIIGNALLFAGNTEDLLNAMKLIYETYPSPVRVWLGNRLYVGIFDPEQVKNVLTSPKAINKDDLYRFAQPWLGTGLFTASASKWKIHRKIIQPAFNQKILRSFMDIFNKHSLIFTRELSGLVGGEEFDISKNISACTINIICESVMGFSSTSHNLKHKNYIHAADRVLAIICDRMCKIWFHPDFIFQFTQMAREMKVSIDYLKSVTSDMIKAKRKEHQSIESGAEQSRNHWKPFLELLMELSDDNEKRFTDQELQEEVDTMLIAGNDTVATIETFTFLMLASHPEIQDKIYRELYEIYGDKSIEESPIQLDDLQRMDYLERFIKETMRLFPVGPVILRRIEDDLDIGGYILPRGVSILISIMRLHRDEKSWPDPLKFDPDRFLPEEIAKRHPFTYIPFSAGPRNCIGLKYAMMSMKVFLATVLRQYVIKKDKITPIQDIRLKLEIVLKPVETITVRIEKRIPDATFTQDMNRLS